MNTVDALKALYAALGGSADAVANMTLIPEVINAIASLASSGGLDVLPKVTDADSGKVLVVVDGHWEVAYAPE